MTPQAPASPAGLIARIAMGDGEALRAHLDASPPATAAPMRSEYDLNPGARPAERAALTPAAVLLPILTRAEPALLFTRRAAHLARHAGQVSFPGGRAEPGDASLAATALRELGEETGIAPQYVDVAGFLDTYETGSGYAILPVVGLVREGFALKSDANEVAEMFEVPLAFLLDPANRREESALVRGRMRRFHAYRYGTHYIWGATAAILARLSERLAA